MTSDSDEGIDTDTLERAVSGNREATERLIAKVAPIVPHLVLGRLGAQPGHFHAVEDVSQECLKGIVVGLPQLRPPVTLTSFRAYLSGVVKRQVARHFEGRAKAMPLADDLAQTRDALGDAATRTQAGERMADPRAGPRTNAERAEEFAQVLACIHKLDEASREIAFLALIEHLKPSDIADRLGIEPHAATMRVTRAILKVRRCLERR